MFKLEAHQASAVFKYQNTKIQLFKTNTHIKFNVLCLKYKIIPKYAIIHINSNTKAAINTKKHAEIYRVKQEIKSLYVKKAILNKTLFKLHLLIYNQIHPAIIDIIMNKVNTYISDTMRTIRQKQTLKLKRLISTQRSHRIPECKHSFYPRTVNLTDITFDSDEMNLLNKGLDYNFPPDNKHNIVDEVINAETAVKAINDSKLQNESRHIINHKFIKILNNRNTDGRTIQKQIRAQAERKTLKNCLLYTSINLKSNPELENSIILSIIYLLSIIL